MNKSVGDRYEEMFQTRLQRLSDEEARALFFRLFGWMRSREDENFIHAIETMLNK